MQPFQTSALALFVILSASADAQPAAAPVREINLQSYAYTPTPIHLRAGQPITLRFVNRSRNGHDFTARQFFRSARILAGRVNGGEVDLGPGQSSSVTLIPAAGTYPVHCGHPFHKMLGMKSKILVH